MQQKLFNSPSLIGVSQRQDVLVARWPREFFAICREQHAHQLPHFSLSAAQVDTLVAYLEGL